MARRVIARYDCTLLDKDDQNQLKILRLYNQCHFQSWFLFSLKGQDFCLNPLPYSQSASDVDPAAEIMSSGQLVHDDAPAPLYVFSPHCSQPFSVM